jgi:hypothetical protein
MGADLSRVQYFMARSEYSYWESEMAGMAPDEVGVRAILDTRATFMDSVQPVIDAGLEKLVDCDAQIVPVKRSCPLGEIGWAIGLEAELLGNLCCLAVVQKIGIKPLELPGSLNPDIAGAQAIAQSCRNSSFVKPVIDLSAFGNEPLPLPVSKRHRHAFGQIASPSARIWSGGPEAGDAGTNAD